MNLKRSNTSCRKPAPEGAQMAQAGAICARFGFSRATLWRMSVNDPNFPRPVRVSQRLTLYSVPAVEAYLNGKAVPA